MLHSLRVKGFKSLSDVGVQLPRFTVLFGPNATGKSNVLDALQALSRIGTLRTVSDALADPIRGYPVEAFRFPPEGLPGLLGAVSARFSLSADLHISSHRYRYSVEVSIQPRTGGLTVSDEYLTELTALGEPRGNPSMAIVDNRIRIRRKSKPAHPRYEDVGLNHSQLSDPRLSGPEYRAFERVRQDLARWRVYYLDPRSAMRSAKLPAEVQDIGVLGEDIGPFLYRLQHEQPKAFSSVKRTLRAVIPSVVDLTVDLDKRRGTLDITVQQGGVPFSSRIISEGTLRVLALCCVAANPWGGSLIAFEEPENGVHPRRLELVVKLLMSLAHDKGRQVIVTSHSPALCSAVLQEARDRGVTSDTALMMVKREPKGTSVVPFAATGALFEDSEIRQALTTPTEDGVFRELLLRGLLDE